MTKKLVSLFALTLMLLASCGGEKSKKETPVVKAPQKEVKKEEPKAETASTEDKASTRIDLKNKGRPH